jgi:type I restriction enzyme, S subunit
MEKGIIFNMKYKTYPQYKPSGVEWLGDVPKHWEIKRLKNITNVISKGTTPSTEGFEISFEGIIRFIKAENIINDNISKYPEFLINEETNKALSRSILQEKDLLIVIAGATIGKVALLTKEFIPANTNQAVCFIRLKKKEMDRFIWYYLRSDFIQNFITINSVQSAQPNISMGILSESILPLPSLSEQKIIVRFLDHETGKIDILVAKKKRLIELLKEKRTALISRAVTQGLDSNVKMKPSGVEWLGDIPAHWEVKKLKYCFELITEKTENKTKIIALENIESWTGHFIETETEFEGDGIAFEKNDILFGKLRPYLAKVLKTDFSGEAVGDFFVMRSHKTIDPDFSLYYLLSKGFIDMINGASFGSKMPRVNWEFMGTVKISLPSLIEQQAIADFLGRETAKIDVLISKIETAVEKLTEYRAAIISAAVTGKIDVRDQI